MTKQEARALLGQWFCGCGQPEEATASLLRLLQLHPIYTHQREFDELVSSAGMQYLLLYMVDTMGLTEHGGSVGGAWLTDRGEALMERLRLEGVADDFRSLSESCCIHGYSIESDDEFCPNC